MATGYEGTYDGQSYGITVNVTDPTDTTISYSTDEGDNKTYSLENPTFENAGTYTVYYKIEKENYETKYGSETIKIAQKEINISWGTVASIPYNGSLQVPEAYATNLVGDDVCTLVTNVVETETGAGSIPGTWTAEVIALSNDNYKLPESGEQVSISFEIVNGTQNDAPVVSGVNETIDGKADGKITGVDSTMEYCMEGEESYTAIEGTELTGLEDGTYHVRYAAKEYYNASPYATVIIDAGRKLTVPGTGDKTPLGLYFTFLIGCGVTAVGFWRKKNGIVEE